MQFIVPQFIEREAKIVGPFTFKQFIFIGTAGALLIFLYFVIESIILYLFVAIFITAIAFALALLKAEGFPLPVVIQRALTFFGKPKLYLWKKKMLPPKILKKERAEVKTKSGEELERKSVLKTAKMSRLMELATFLETKRK